MEITKQEYQKYVQAREKSSPIVKNCVLAFAIGGGICVLGQAIMKKYGKSLFSSGSFEKRGFLTALK